jgi:hypothetical protein
MRFRSRWFPTVLALVCLMGFDATSGSPKVPPELIGKWNYASMTALKDGKPFGTVHFQPGQWTVTFNQDFTWLMKTPSPSNPGGLSGSYEVHGHDLDMKLASGKPYYKYRFTIEQDGKVLVLTTKEATISAGKE